MDRLDALKLLVRVVETGGFSRAARELGVTQPAASRAIAALEARWSARLFHRTTRSLTPTEAGRSAYERALTVLAEADALEAAVRSADRNPVGLLRLSGSVAFTRMELTPLVGAFLETFPQMKLDLVARDDRIDLVGEAIDLAFRLGALPDSGLTARRLGRYPRWLVASPAYIGRWGMPQTPEALADLPTVAFSSAPFGVRWPLTQAERHVEVATRSDVRASSGDLVRDLTIAGQGIALLPSFLVAQDLADGALVRVLDPWTGPALDLHAIWSARALPRKARAYLDFMTPHLSCV